MRIAVVYDVDGWAWHKRAVSLQKHAGCEVLPVRYGEVDSRTVRRCDAVLTHMWQSGARKSGVREWAIVTNGKLQYRFDAFSDDFRQRCTTRTHCRERAKKCLHEFHGILCLNPHAAAFARSVNSLTRELRTGVDTEVYYPAPSRTGSRLRVGWCGKPSEPGRFSGKGYEEILLPLMQQLPGIDWQVNTRTADTALNETEMREWYSSLDLFLVTASAEGTPSTALEALACGTPVVGTEVGILPLLAEDGAAVHLCGSYHNQEGTRAVIERFVSHLSGEPAIRRHPDTCALNRSIIEEKWSWKKLAPLWVRTATA